MAERVPGIHGTAVIDPAAVIGSNVHVGPHCFVGAGVQLGDGCVLQSHVSVQGPARIGPFNVFFPFAAVGGDPQDLKYQGEDTAIEMGEGNLVREFVTLNRGTQQGGGVTRIGDGNLFMAYVHVAHDCTVGSRTIFANGATLAGHVEVADGATIGAGSAVHQYCRVGVHAFIGGYSVLTRDVLPYMKTVGARTEGKVYGVNTIGLERKGFAKESVEALERVHRILFRSKMLLQDAIGKADADYGQVPEVRLLLEFIRTSQRGFHR